MDTSSQSTISAMMPRSPQARDKYGRSESTSRASAPLTRAMTRDIKKEELKYF
jgi:hypothetical protein